jgi:hypothetical protein
MAYPLFGRRVALVAASCLGLAYLHVRNSHFGKTDIALALLFCVALLFIVEAYREQRLRSYALAGVFAGLAVSTKYIGILLILPMLLTHLFVMKRLTVAGWTDKRLLLFFVALVVMSVIGTPFAFLDPEAFLSHMTAQGAYLQTGGPTQEVGRGWWSHLLISLNHGMGWPLLIASIGGILIMLKWDRNLAFVVLSLLISYYALFGWTQVVFTRYMVPLVPILCVTSALCIVHILDACPGLRSLRGATAFAVILVLLPSLFNILELNNLLVRTDNRLIAADWIQANLPDGGSIYQVGDRTARLPLEPTLKDLVESYTTLAVADDVDSTEAMILKIKIEDRERRPRSGYNEWFYDDRANQFTTKDAVVMNGLPDYVILFRYPAIPYNQPTPYSLSLVNEFYTLVQVFQAVDLQIAEGNVYDVQDAFYLPYAGFAGVSRPGPNVYIYALNRFSSFPADCMTCPDVR